MQTIEQWDNSLKTNGLIETIDLFDKYVLSTTDNIVWPCYSFAHIVLDDFNLEDWHIKWCLENEQVNEYLIDKLRYVLDEYTNYDNYDYWLLVEGADLTIQFLEWLLTVPEEVREAIYE